MGKKLSKVISTRWLPLNLVVIAPYYDDLYPLPRDWSRLRESFEQHGYKPEYPVTVRPPDKVTGAYEIVCGVGRFVVAGERRMRRIPVIVRDMSDTEARRYAIEDNLYSPTTVANISLVQAISLARVLAACGMKYPARRLWELAKGSESTYWRAIKSLDHAIDKVVSDHPDLQELELQHQVAEILRRDLFPDFTKLWKGETEVNTFHQLHSRAMSKTDKARVIFKRVARAQADRPQRKATELRANSSVEIPSNSALAYPESSQDTAKVVKRSIPREKVSKVQMDDNLSLFDFSKT